MRVPLTVTDFLERAELVYGERIGVVDEPEQPAPSWGAMSWREIAQSARAQAAGLDALGVGRGRARGGRVAELGAPVHRRSSASAGAGRILVPINFRLNAEEISYIVEHSGAWCCSSTPSWMTPCATSTRSCVS